MAAVEGTLDLIAMPSQEHEVQVFFWGGGGLIRNQLNTPIFISPKPYDSPSLLRNV